MDEPNKKSMNDVENHLDHITGNPTKINTKGMPKGIRIIGYFFIAFFTLLILTMLYAAIFK